MASFIIAELSSQGFLTDIKRSHRVAAWAYQQAIDNNYLFWDIKVVATFEC